MLLVTIQSFELLLKHADLILLEQQHPRTKSREPPVEAKIRVGSNESSKAWVTRRMVFDCTKA